MRESPSKYFSGLRFNEDMKNCDVFDVNDKKLGRLLDAVVKKTDDGWDLSKFTIGGSRFQELLEDLGVKPDIDPVFPVDLIASVAPRSIKLSVPGDSLKSTTIEADAIGSDEIKLSQLSSVKLIDAEDKNMGNIIDMKFADGHFHFVLGDGAWKEFLEDIGLLTDVDYLISPKYIDSIDAKTIKLSQSKKDLDILFKGNLKSDYGKVKELENAKATARAYSTYYPVR